MSKPIYHCSIHDFSTEDYYEFEAHLRDESHEIIRDTSCPACGTVQKFIIDTSDRYPSGRYKAICPACKEKVQITP